VPNERSYQTSQKKKWSGCIRCGPNELMIQQLFRRTVAKLKLSYCLHRISPTRTTKHQIILPFWGKNLLLLALKVSEGDSYQNRRLDYFISTAPNLICELITIGQYSTFFSSA
jgi:hypothetical protein